MGTPVDPYPDDWGYGDDCPACTPDLWVSGQTPLYVRAVFSGMVKCNPAYPDPPNDKIFTMKQIALSPCGFRIDRTINGDIWRAHYYPFWAPDKTHLSLWHVGLSRYYFYYQDTPKCQGADSHEFANQADCAQWWNFYGSGGVAHAWWDPDDIPHVLSSQYHFTTLPGSLYDRGFCGIHHQWIRIANKKDHTNVHFYIDNQEFAPYD